MKRTVFAAMNNILTVLFARFYAVIAYKKKHEIAVERCMQQCTVTLHNLYVHMFQLNDILVSLLTCWSSGTPLSTRYSYCIQGIDIPKIYRTIHSPLVGL